MMRPCCLSESLSESCCGVRCDKIQNISLFCRLNKKQFVYRFIYFLNFFLQQRNCSRPINVAHLCFQPVAYKS